MLQLHIGLENPTGNMTLPTSGGAEMLGSLVEKFAQPSMSLKSRMAGCVCVPGSARSGQQAAMPCGMGD